MICGLLNVLRQNDEEISTTITLCISLETRRPSRDRRAVCHLAFGSDFIASSWNGHCSAATLCTTIQKRAARGRAEPGAIPPTAHSAEMSSRLLVVDDDYLVKKVMMTAACAKIELVIVKGQTHAALLALHPDAKSMVLQAKDGSAITQHLSILRFLADLAPAAGLLGTTSFDLSQVEQWLHFTWQQLGESLSLSQFSLPSTPPRPPSSSSSFSSSPAPTPAPKI